MQIDKVTAAVSKYFEAKWNKPIKIVEVTRAEDGWAVRFEVTEESDYMIRFARDEMIGVYLAEVSSSLEIVGFKRLGLKNRTTFEEIGPDA